jgi:hypothetical protein
MVKIKDKYVKIIDKLKRHDAKRKLIEAELLALQHVCPHENVKEWDDGGGYGGPSWSSHYWDCADCGLRKIN